MKLSELERKLAEYRCCGFGDDSIVYAHVDETQEAPGRHGGARLKDLNLFSSEAKLAEIAALYSNPVAPDL